MKPILVLYATREGQSRKVATKVVESLREATLTSELYDAALLPSSFDASRYEAAVLVASVHIGAHEREIVRFVRKNHAFLEHVPTAFLSLSLSQAGAEDSTRSQAERERALHDTTMMIERFFKATGFRTRHVLAVAGALMYSRYNPFVRFLMKRRGRGL